MPVKKLNEMLAAYSRYSRHSKAFCGSMGVWSTKLVIQLMPITEPTAKPAVPKNHGSKSRFWRINSQMPNGKGKTIEMMRKYSTEVSNTTTMSVWAPMSSSKGRMR